MYSQDFLIEYAQKKSSEIEEFWAKEFQSDDRYAPVKKIIFESQLDESLGGMSELFKLFFRSLVSFSSYDYEFNQICIREGLFERVENEYGLIFIEYTLAHEWAHHIQFLLQKEVNFLELDLLETRKIELQADCISGFYFNQNSLGKEEVLQIKRTLENLGGDDEHGSSQERMKAFEKGLQFSHLNECFKEEQ